MWIVKTGQIFAIHSTNQSIQQSFCSYYYNLDKRKMILYDIQHSYVFWICYLWSIDWVLCQYWRIQHSIQISKCEWRLILLITITIKNQTHPIWFNDDQIDNSMICDSLIYKQMNDWLLDWSNGKSSMIPNPIQFNRIWSNSSLVAVIIQ